MNIGVERERFIVCPMTGQVLPVIGELLPVVHDIADHHGVEVSRFTFELCASQIEDKTPPCRSLVELEQELQINDGVLRQAAGIAGIAFDHSEFVEAHQFSCLQVNPFDQRHQEIWQRLTSEIQLAASAVAAVHVHIEVDQSTAVDVLNHCRHEQISQLISLGDHSDGRRIDSYRQMARATGVPPRFTSYADVEAHIASRGGEKNVWDLVRYKPSTQTVEFRMFGATPSIPEIIGYARACLEVVG